MLDQLQGLHIETTNMCTLKCPRCARTEFVDQFPKRWVNKNLNLEHLKNFLDIDLKDKQITLCGNYGDTIYYDQLFDLIKYAKIANARIKLVTNGSYKTAEWWHQLGTLLDEQDEIVFAIDGTPDNFTKYRINGDWNSIAVGINALQTSKCRLTWKHILFSYNENTIEEAQEMSIRMGFDKFLLVNSDRWDNGTEWLTPTSTLNSISEHKIEWKKDIKNVQISPGCKINNKMHFISADGFYTPCCMAAEHRFYYTTEFYKNRDLYDISKTTISQILTHLADFYSTLEDAKLNYCTFNCPKL